jgi:four helix bundle protein
VDLRKRTKELAKRIIRLYCSLPKSDLEQVMGRQILRSGTSVGAQYREAHRSRSDAEFVSKVEKILQELDETSYWLELLMESGVVKATRLGPLLKEVDELIAIFVTCAKNTKKRMKREKRGRKKRDEL